MPNTLHKGFNIAYQLIEGVKSVRSTSLYQMSIGILMASEPLAKGRR